MREWIVEALTAANAHNTVHSLYRIQRDCFLADARPVARAIELRRKLVNFESARDRYWQLKPGGWRPRMFSVKVSGMTRLRQKFEVSGSFRFGNPRQSFTRLVKFRSVRISFSRELFRVFHPALMDDGSQLFREGWAVSKGRRKLFHRSIARHKGCTKPKSSSPSNRLWHGAKVSVFVFYLYERLAF